VLYSDHSSLDQLSSHQYKSGIIIIIVIIIILLLKYLICIGEIKPDPQDNYQRAEVRA
jgi:hypothetical protein